MVGTIPFVGYGGQRRPNLQMLLVLHGGGYLCGSAVLGLVAVMVGAFIRGLVPIDAVLVGGILCLLYGLREVGIARVAAPQLDRAVPHGWRLRFKPLTACFLYGTALGVVVMTRIPNAAVYPVVAWIILQGRLLPGMLVSAGLGIGKLVPVAYFSNQLRIGGEGRPIPSGMRRLAPSIGYCSGLALAFCGTWLIVS